MTKIPALRIRHEHNIPLAIGEIDPAAGFTLEAWFKVAPVDRNIRLYEEANYGGRVLQLPAEAYRALAARHFDTIGSVCLPLGMEAVFFSQPDFGGNAWVVRADCPVVSPAQRQAGSLVVVDRFHRRQSHVVLFEEQNFQGRAALLRAAEAWHWDKPEAADQPPLKQIGSAWVPPGVGLTAVCRRTFAVTPKFESPVKSLGFAFGGIGVATPDFSRTENVYAAYDNFYNDKKYENPTEKDLIHVQEGQKLILFSENNYAGDTHILTPGWHQIMALPWPAKSFLRYETGGRTNNQFDGVLLFTWQGICVCPAGAILPDGLTYGANVWIPPNFELIAADDDNDARPTRGPGYYENILISSYQVSSSGGAAGLPAGPGDKVIISRQGDLATFPHDTVSIRAARVPPREGYGLTYNGDKEQAWPAAWYQSPPDFHQVDVPQGYALFLFEDYDYAGRQEVVIGQRDDLGSLGWVPRSAIYAKAPGGTNGVIWLTETVAAEIAVYNAANPMATELKNGFYGGFYVPPGYQLVPGPESTTATVYGPGYYKDNLEDRLILNGYEVQRYAGIVTNGGWGLMVERQDGRFGREGERLRFAGKTIRPDRWYHLALTFDGQHETWFLDGKAVQTRTGLLPALTNSWLLGEQLRGTLAQVRLWDRALTEKELKAFRYPSADAAKIFPDGLPASLMVQELAAYAAPPDAVIIDSSGELPQPPTATALTSNMLQQARVKNQQEMLVARQGAQKSVAQAQQRARYKMARAHEQARRDIHLHGIDLIAFLRGGNEYVSIAPEGGKSTLSFQGNIRSYSEGEQDLFLDRQNNVLFMVSNGYANADSQGLILAKRLVMDESESGLRLIDWLKERPVALAGVSAEGHLLTTRPTSANPFSGLYWLEANGRLNSLWVEIGDSFRAVTRREVGQVTKNAAPVPLGRGQDWDLVVGSVYSYEMEAVEGGMRHTIRTDLYWTNGWAVYRGKDFFEVIVDTNGNLRLEDGALVSPKQSLEIETVVPNTYSPRPVAVAVSDKGEVVWLDAEDGMVRKTKIGPDSEFSTGTRPTDLYRAPSPAPGLAICQLPAPDDGNQAVSYLYWVAREERTLEVPVLDTPGRYLDVYDNGALVKPGHRPEDVVQIEDTVGMQWAAEDCVMRLQEGNGITYGPFSLDKGFAIEFSVKKSEAKDFGDIIKFNEGQFVFGFNYEVVQAADGSWKMVDGRFDCLWQSSPSGYDVGQSAVVQGFEADWVHLRLELKRSDPTHNMFKTLKIIMNGQELAWDSQDIVNAGQIIDPLPDLISFTLPGDGANNRGTIDGLIDQLLVTTLDKSAAILAERQVRKQSGLVKGASLKTDFVLLPAGSASTDLVPSKIDVLSFSDNVDHVVLSPLRLDLDAGWTVTADLIWDKPVDLTLPVCVYELATYEDEERFVCAIDADGQPRVYVRWQGKNIRGWISAESFDEIGPSEFVPLSLESGQQYRVTWTIERSGLLITYINERLARQETTGWTTSGARVFEIHRLGAPNDSQYHTLVPNGMAPNSIEEVDDFAGFTGKIIRFTAWNTFLPGAASGPAHLPTADPTWDRSLITIRSSRRYLHAGRLDGAEPPVTLFPIEMDGSLIVESRLDHNHAALTEAHNRMAAARHFEMQQKQTAYDKAHAQWEAAHENYLAVSAQAEADRAAASRAATAKEAQARQKRATADNKAEVDRAQAVLDEKAIKAQGDQDAAKIKQDANNEKDRVVGTAASRLRDKQSERDRKHQDYVNRS